MSKVYTIPPRFDDATWLKGRNDMIHALSNQNAEITVDMTSCEWLDLHPLSDLLLYSVKRLIHGLPLLFLFDSEGLSPQGRVLRFLNETGFFNTINDTARQQSTRLEYQIGTKKETADSLHVLLGNLSLARKVLDTTTILPCTIANAAELKSREDVFNYCRNVREKYVSQPNMRALRISVPLIHELKLYFSTILPELVDNVRLHKRSNVQESLFTMYVRIRRRDESLAGARRVADKEYFNLTKFKKLTYNFWEHDIVEAVFSDDGPSIQETWIDGWHKEHALSTKRVPRLPESNRRVDKKNGDFLILRGILTENASSLRPEERAAHGLPLKATGLNSIRRSLGKTNCTFAVRSGQNYAIVIKPDGKSEAEDDTDVKVRLGGQFDYSVGVQYFFRFSPLQGRPLASWVSGCPKEGIENAASWWDSEYKSRFDRVHFTSVYEIPTAASRGDVVVCRAHHMLSKQELATFLSSALLCGINLIFAELPTPFALRLYNYLKILSAEMQLSIPIITNNLRVQIVAPRERLAVSSFVREEDIHYPYWWTEAESPLRCIRELFNLSRIRDSTEFWRIALNEQGTFLHETVKWTEDFFLTGGYLVFQSAFRLPKLRKLVRKRLVMLVEQLTATQLVPSSEALRTLCSEVENSAYLETEDSDRKAIIGSVFVTGRTMENAAPRPRIKDTNLRVPIFVYPINFISGRTGEQYTRQEQLVRALDWCLEPKVETRSVNDHQQKGFILIRKGNTEYVSKKPMANLIFHSRQKAIEAYATWQRYSLLEIGHFSYGPHHYYVWIDLRRHISSGTPEALAMISEMWEKLNEWQPQWIFYESHETAEVLVDKLCEESISRNADVIIREKTLPISDIAVFSALHGNPGDNRTPRDHGRAVIIDDGMVTGRTILRDKTALYRIGFSEVFSLVVLDRDDPDKCLLGGLPKHAGDHFSWWSLFVPPAGNSKSCRICKGLESIRGSATATGSDALRSVLESWSERWAERDNLDRFRAAIEGRTLKKTLLKAFGDPAKRDLSILYSEALCTWVLDLTKRLDWPTIFLEGEHDVEEFQSEALAGILLHHWEELADAYKGVLLDRILDQLWEERRTAARGLLAISLLSLNERESRALYKRLSYKIAADGLPHLETAAFAYATVRKISRTRAKAEERFYSWAKGIHEGKSSVEKIKIMKTNTLVTALAAADHRGTPVRFALQILGLPGRGIVHQHLYTLLDEVENASEIDSDKIEALALIRTYLDPVRACFNAYKTLFDAAKLSEHLTRTFSDFDSLFHQQSEFSPTSKKILEKDFVAELMQRLQRLLKTDYQGLRNVRQVLSRQYVHYLPFLARTCIAELIGKQMSNGVILEEGDIEVIGTITSSEKKLFDDKWAPNEAERDSLVDCLQEYDVAIVDRGIAELVIRDCLMDAKHPKKMLTGLGQAEGKPYMRVLFAMEEGASGQPELCMFFENRGTEDQYRASHGNSWLVVCTILREAGGNAVDHFDDQLIKRKLTFPALKHRMEA